ncbi:MAG: heme oxygenase [Planctomycetes bacterium]|jgi:heme oxygenase|nr:heme oxygenase [Planctomycetota bacterium]
MKKYRVASIGSIFTARTLSPLSRRTGEPKTGRVDGPVELVRDNPDATFSQRLRAETAQAHRVVESTAFVKAILRGIVDIENFITMQSGLYMIYSAMEQELERHSEHPLVRRVYFKVLRRTEVLERDLEFLAGPDWAVHLRGTPARDEYIERLRWLGDNDPELLVAHSYTRYLGDLSGGQVVAKIVRRALGLRDDDGLGFFSFDEIENAKAFKDEYRRRLDELPLRDRLGERIIEEAKRVFGLNRRMFEELEGSWVRALAKLLPFGFFLQQRRA